LQKCPWITEANPEHFCPTEITLIVCNDIVTAGGYGKFYHEVVFPITKVGAPQKINLVRGRQSTHGIDHISHIRMPHAGLEQLPEVGARDELTLEAVIPRT
jgi:hypothetical protein